ncbi:MAG TPA: helix-turn-helix domain-containing protein [Tepidisphaeraceae bacterium]|jgi:excisionase family DNA binding protein|nr:helix-turn-helix domain-containing protein [Tepidisphaeraceae bacterium]
MGATPLDKMLTVSEVARELDRSVARVRQFIDSGELPARKVNPRLYLIDPADLARFRKRKRPPGWKKGRKRGKARAKTRPRL